MRNKSRKRILQELRIQNNALENLLRQRFDDRIIVKAPAAKTFVLTRRIDLTWSKDWEFSYNMIVDNIRSIRKEMAEDIANKILDQMIGTIKTKQLADGTAIIRLELSVLEE